MLLFILDEMYFHTFLHLPSLEDIFSNIYGKFLGVPVLTKIKNSCKKNYTRQNISKNLQCMRVVIFVNFRMNDKKKKTNKTLVCIYISRTWEISNKLSIM